MRVGTPQFVGARLQQARQTRQLTAKSLAEQLGLKSRTVTAYETGQITPSPEMFDRIVELMDFPSHFFLTPIRTFERGPLFYRSMATTAAGARTRAEHRFSWMREIVQYISEFVELPAPNFPALELPDRFVELGMEDVEQFAATTRRYWALPRGPISNSVRLLEHHGAIVIRDRLGASTLDGLSEVANGRPFIAIATDKGTAVRWRFDAGHELGHVLMHRAVSADSLRSPAEFRLIEDQAHRFAAAFLLPLDGFLDDLVSPTLDGLRSLKTKWRVSIGMMIRRLYDGEIISEDTYRNLMINYSRRGWRTNEPLDNSLEAEMPSLLAQAFEMIVESGLRSPAEIITELALPPSDLEALAGLQPGFLTAGSEAPPRLRLVRDAR